MNRIERRYPGYTREQLFALVADVEKYPEFVPWITASRILGREGNTVRVDMVFGLGLLQYRFTSKGVLDPPRAIDIWSEDAPFESFLQRWEFSTGPDGGAAVTYCYEFSLRSQVLDLLSHAVLDEALRASVHSFERRARQLYGDPQSARIDS